MKREEYNELRSIKSSLKKLTLGHGTTLTIRTDASPEYQHKLDEFYTGLNFHPASVRVDRRMYDDKERIIYIFSRTWTDNEGRERPCPNGGVFRITGRCDDSPANSPDYQRTLR